MTPQTVAFVLKLFQQSWQGLFKVESYTAHIWAEASVAIGDEDGMAAARRLVLALDRPPSIARFREECALVKRNNTPVLPPGPIEPGVGHARSVRVAAALSRGLKAASDLIPEHDHREDKAIGKRKGWIDCPACSTADARQHEVLAAIRSEVDEVMP